MACSWHGGHFRHRLRARDRDVHLVYQVVVAINALLDRLPNLHLDPTVPEPVINGVAFRSPATLPVEFTPA